mgnify:CR=1 FL=1
MEKKVAWWFSFIGFLWLLPYVVTVALNGIDTAFLNRLPEVEDYLPFVYLAILSIKLLKQRV